MGAARFLFVPALMVCVALLVGPSELRDKWDHLRTMGLALQTLYGMDQSDFDNFLGSYDVFDTPQSNSSDEVKVNAVYKILVPLMALGSLKKYYIPPVMDESKNNYKYLNHNQVLFEQAMADTIGLKPGQVGLDIGCGSGFIADTVQEHTGAKIVGINISPDQIATARANAERNGKLGKLLDFQVASMNDPLPFPDNSFDAVYVMQAICYVHNPVALMAEVRRVLKPGGLFSDLSIVMLDKFNASNQTQHQMMKNAQRISVVTTFRPKAEYEEACTQNGFSLKTSKLLGAADMTQAAIDYFVPLGGVIRMANKVGLMGDNVMQSMDRMTEYGVDLVTGEREELFSINYWIVCQAPL
jgi:sterol 24-C-methyltransferase